MFGGTYIYCDDLFIATMKRWATKALAAARQDASTKKPRKPKAT